MKPTWEGGNDSSTCWFAGVKDSRSILLGHNSLKALLPKDGLEPVSEKWRQTLSFTVRTARHHWWVHFFCTDHRVGVTHSRRSISWLVIAAMTPDKKIFVIHRIHWNQILYLFKKKHGLFVCYFMFNSICTFWKHWFIFLTHCFIYVWIALWNWTLNHFNKNFNLCTAVTEDSIRHCKGASTWMHLSSDYCERMNYWQPSRRFPWGPQTHMEP